jgi:uncharacterized protein YjiS (DUF1127 family)
MTTIEVSLPRPRVLSLGSLLSATWARMREARRLRETRRYIQEMDGHMLSDIGVSRAQALFEIDRELRQLGR